MNYRKLLIIFALILIVSSCSDFVMICSLNPFFLDENVVTDRQVEGNWQARQIQSENDAKSKNSSHWEKADTTGVWHIKQFVAKEKVKTKRGTDSTVFKPQNYYEVKLTGSTPDTVKYQFRLTLFRIKGVLYGDFSPIGSTFSPPSRMAKENYFTVHTLSRIQIKNRQLFFSWLSTDCMREMIEKKRVRVKYRYVPDAGRLLLTATSESLTEMIERYAFQKRFIDWDNQPAMLNLSPINQQP
jgi:hypothetical protein